MVVLCLAVCALPLAGEIEEKERNVTRGLVASLIENR